MTSAQWDTWLHTWNRELLGRHDRTKYNAFVDPLVTPAVLDSGWLGAPGASEPDITALEHRLRTTLPPSYRTFLAASNGFLQPGVIVPRLLPASEVQWLRDSDPDMIESWREGVTAVSEVIAPETAAELEAMSAALQVSARETIGTAMYLLNPQVVGPDGEWQALYFAHWIPGFRYYPSFWELMQAEQAGL
jgi:SMI1/KNR4 family protein SUKH-1